MLETNTNLIAIGDGGKALVGRHKGYISTDADFSNPFDKGDLAKQINNLYAGLSSIPHQEQLTAATNLNNAKSIRDTYIAGYGSSDIGKTDRFDVVLYAGGKPRPCMPLSPTAAGICTAMHLTTIPAL